MACCLYLYSQNSVCFYHSFGRESHMKILIMYVLIPLRIKNAGWKATCFCSTRIYGHIYRNGREFQLSSLISVRRCYFKSLNNNSVNRYYEELNWPALYKKVSSYLTENTYHFHFEDQSFSAVYGSSRCFENIMKQEKKCVGKTRKFVVLQPLGHRVTIGP
jgi:hypothetical protein